MVDLKQGILNQALKKIRDQLDLFIEMDVIHKKDRIQFWDGFIRPWTWKQPVARPTTSWR